MQIILLLFFLLSLININRSQELQQDSNSKESFYFKYPIENTELSIGSNITIKWVHNIQTVPKFITLKLLKGSIEIEKLIIFSNKNYTDFYNWFIPNDLESNYYSFKLINQDNPSITGKSDIFIIKGSEELPNKLPLKIIYPTKNSIITIAKPIQFDFIYDPNTLIYPPKINVFAINLDTNEEFLIIEDKYPYKIEKDGKEYNTTDYNFGFDMEEGNYQIKIVPSNVTMETGVAGEGISEEFKLKLPNFSNNSNSIYNYSIMMIISLIVILIF